MSSKQDYPTRFDDGLAIEVARSIRLFKKLIFLGSVSSVGIDIVRMAAADLLSSIADHEQSLQHKYKNEAKKKMSYSALKKSGKLACNANECG